LVSIACNHNKLTSLDVTQNVELGVLNCGENLITGLDLTHNTGLASGFNSGIPSLFINDMPTLYMVCVWEMPFPPANLIVEASGSPNVYYSTECNK
jgi:hypothetical protein